MRPRPVPAARARAMGAAVVAGSPGAAPATGRECVALTVRGRQCYHGIIARAAPVPNPSA
jgi:hypothetical protein